MPEPYGALDLEIPKGKGEVPNLPQVLKDYTDSLDDAFTAPSGELLIAQPADVAKFKAMKGDATLADDGTLTLAQRAGARVLNSTEVAITGSPGNFLTIPWGSELYDIGGMHSTSSNTSRLTAPVAGTYLFEAQFQQKAGAETFARVGVRFRLNGTTVIHENKQGKTSENENQAKATSTLYRLAASDYVEVQFLFGGAAENEKIGVGSYFAAQLLSN